MPSGSPLSAAVMVHNPGRVGSVCDSGISLRLPSVLGLPAVKVPITKTGASARKLGLQNKKLISRRCSRSEATIHLFFCRNRITELSIANKHGHYGFASCTGAGELGTSGGLKYVKAAAPKPTVHARYSINTP